MAACHKLLQRTLAVLHISQFMLTFSAPPATRLFKTGWEKFFPLLSISVHHWPGKGQCCPETKSVVNGQFKTANCWGKKKTRMFLTET